MYKRKRGEIGEKKEKHVKKFKNERKYVNLHVHVLHITNVYLQYVHVHIVGQS